MKPLLEAIPNFSEGHDRSVIDAIAKAIISVKGVQLLNIDPNAAANRTVYTFIGEPSLVVEAGFRAVQVAAEKIDMSQQKGEHPRIGATDVFPLVPFAGMSMEEAVEWSKKLGKRVGEELGIPVYLYEYAQPDKKRSALPVIRAGRYEGFFAKILLPAWKPDFGPSLMNKRSGASVIGARDFLGAFNVNLNTTSVDLANKLAKSFRESGYSILENNSKKKIPGKFKSLRAIGWYIEDFKIAQVSMNFINMEITPIHLVFDELCKEAAKLGLRVTGSEMIGMLPLKYMLAAGKYFLEKQGSSTEVSEEELVHIAVRSLGLNDVKPFVAKERIIEYGMRQTVVSKQ